MVANRGTVTNSAEKPNVYTTYDADGELLLNPLSPLMYSSATCAAVPLAGFGSAPAPELPPSSPSAL